MSPRRFLVVVVALLAALVGAAAVALALVALRDPVQRTGELGTPTDVGAELLGALLLGLALLLAGAATAVLLVRRQLRSAP